VHNISAVATSVTAFVGYTSRGIDHTAQRIESFYDFERSFGGLGADSELSYAVSQFFANGGSQAYVVRVPSANGGLPGTDDLIGDPAASTGIHALEKVDLFNLLVVPDATRPDRHIPETIDRSVDPNRIYMAAIKLCRGKRAFLLVDPPPGVNTATAAAQWKAAGLAIHEPDGAACFPRLRIVDPLAGGQLRMVGPSGSIAGVYARIDVNRGVWIAPAGADAALEGVDSLASELSAAESRTLDESGLNCVRTMPGVGPILTGARTLVGAGAATSDWIYVSVRRMALFIEQSIASGTQWAGFEPNAEPLWAEIRLSAGAFMHKLFLTGAFAGQMPSQAYFVKCDRTTVTQENIDQGTLNIVVGFAPVKPAEFVVIRIQQLAGQPSS
jgi:phage tail sheath protein FI